MTSRQEHYIVLRYPGRKSLRVRPGQRVRVGRHSSNDLVIDHATVSRFHAVVGWEKGEDRPYVLDNESANGVTLDGAPVEARAYIARSLELGVGDCLVLVDYRGAGSAHDTGPILKDGDEEVALFSEEADDWTGRVRDRNHLQQVLLTVEESQRTGTLHIDGPQKARIMFSRGRIVEASHAHLTGLSALEQVLATCAGCRYTLTAAVEPCEAPLNLSVSRYLSTRAGMIETKHLETPSTERRAKPKD